MRTATSKFGHRAAQYSKYVSSLAIAAAASVLCTSATYAQGEPNGTSNDAVMYEHLMKAREIAGDDLKMDYYHRCLIEPLYRTSIDKLINGTAAVAPAKIFDNFYFVGQNAVSAWALKTDEGIILIDTENNPAQANEYIEGGLEKLGLDPKQIKYIIITHEHADHFGGSRYLQEKYGAHVLASAPEWKNMPTANRGVGLNPHPDMVVKDGEVFTFGDENITFYITPGHTDGTLSFIFKVTDHGVPHTVGFFGGMGSPYTEINRDKIIASYERWRKITAAAGVDTLITNHQGEDQSVEKIEFLRIRHPDDPNPFVIGKDAYQRYFEIQAECERADLARNGEKVPE